jgi:cholesterol transport system auxiliary component
MPPIRTMLLALAAIAAAPGCAAVSAITAATTPLDAYALTPASSVAAATASGRQIAVELPTAGGGIDTDRILIKPSPLQARYLPGVRWIDPAPALVQSLLVASLQDTGAFSHVGRPQAGPLPDYTLLTDIRAFQAEATTAEGPPYRTRVALVLSLVREEDNGIVSTRIFTGERIAETAEPALLVPAFDAATDDVLREAVAWLIGSFGLGA